MTFAISLAVVLLFVLWGFFSPSQLTETATNVLHATTSNFGWFYLLVTFFFLVFCIFLAFSKYGQIRLGDDDDEPEYSAVTWCAMLFSAGMGIGLVF